MSDLININTASAEIIATLPGIGAGLAEKIVTYRSDVRQFGEPIELVVVSGISARMVQEIAPLITVTSRDTATMTTLPPEQEIPPTDPAPELPDSVAVHSDDRSSIAEEREKDVVESRGVVTLPLAPLRPTLGGWQMAGLGALLGMILTLGVLALLNRTLFFGSTTQLQQLEGQVEAAIEQRSELERRIVDAEQKSAESLHAIATLEAEISDGMGAVLTAGEGINVFLDGMENVVRTLRPESVVEAVPSTATPTNTPTALTTMTVTPTNAATITPTRTPRPTATPIGTPES